MSPVPVYFIDAGVDVYTGQSLKDTPEGNIVRTAYREWLWNNGKKHLDDQRPSWDPAAVYFAVEGPGHFLEDTGPGQLAFDAEKGCRWTTTDKRNNQCFIIQKKGVTQAFAAYLNQMIALVPERPKQTGG